MKVSDLLEYVGEYLDDRNSSRISGPTDDLWSDKLICTFMTNAQVRLARRAWVIIETGKAPAGVIVLMKDAVLYPLHPAVLRVYDATPSTQLAPLGRAGDIELRDVNTLGSNSPSLDPLDVGMAAVLSGNTSSPGPTIAFASDAGTKMLRVYPPPDASTDGIVVALKIARLPLCPITTDDTSLEPEVPEEYHVMLGDYAIGRCLSMPHVGDAQKVEGRALLSEFEAHVKEARQERIRAELSAERWEFRSTTALLGNTWFGAR